MSPPPSTSSSIVSTGSSQRPILSSTRTSPAMTLTPSRLFSIKKEQSWSEADLKKRESFGIKGDMSDPVLVKRRLGRAVGLSTLLSSQHMGFKADGPDDMANLAKETVEGIAQPLVHLGVLSLFYPFVAMGAQGLAQDNQEIQQAYAEGKRDIQQAQTELEALKNEGKQEGQPEAQRALKTLQHQQLCLKQDRAEAWSAAQGMRGMQGAMQLFMLEAASSLMTFMTGNAASSVFSTVAAGLGVVGTGVMGGAQFLMMVSGIMKAKSGRKNFQEMRQTCQKNQERLEKIQDSHPHAKNKKQALTRKISDDMRIGKLAMLQKVVPGATLATGQALMLAWSATSLALVFSGVAAPVGLAMMLSLLIPGVGLTLAASMPKIGLEAYYERTMDSKFGVHDKDDGFDTLEYIKQLPIDESELAGRACTLEDQLKKIEDMNETEFQTFLLSENGSVESDEIESDYNSRFNSAYASLKKINQLEALSADIVKIKGAQSLFRTEHVVEYKPVDKVVSWKNIKNPLNLRKSTLFNKEDQRVIVKKTYHFEPERVQKKSLLHDKVLHVATDTLREFAKRQLRAELRATQQALGAAIHI